MPARLFTHVERDRLTGFPSEVSRADLTARPHEQRDSVAATSTGAALWNNPVEGGDD
ncbi:MAG: hypothetical protein QNL12_03300 [Acidimicrobiia bacterium]|nr:hypothetical protein [Acidimicrobiia bacterium]